MSIEKPPTRMLSSARARSVVSVPSAVLDLSDQAVAL